jgi:hypothetical protein
MLVKVLEWLGLFTIIVLLLTWTPSVSDYPMPEWLLDNAEQMFVYMKLLLQFPVLNTAYSLASTFFVYIWLPIQAYNIILKFLGVFPSLEHLKRFQIKD